MGSPFNIVDAAQPAWRWLFQKTARKSSYQPQGAGAGTLLCFVRGVRSEDLFAAAMQQDLVGIIDAAEFAAVFPARLTPARLDRLKSGGNSYAVEAWRGAPADTPVFFKLLLRGGTQ